ncbi:MAG: DUF1320 domain-containing protein [Ignavibacteria bacterium]|nr:DUF1320 domain-containing protein [Ignavibacteria bacterium]
MAYITEAEMLKFGIRKGELEDLTKPGDGDAETTAAEILEEAITNADDKINTYLRGVITELPLEVPPPVIKRASYDITLYYLYDRETSVDIPDKIKEKYDGTIKWLEAIATGKAQLPIDIPDTQIEGTIWAETTQAIFGKNSF